MHGAAAEVVAATTAILVALAAAQALLEKHLL
jgi:hypothetical protein